MWSITERSRTILHRLEYRHWIRRGYLVGRRHAVIYRFKDTYQFVAEHQNECGYLSEDETVFVLPRTLEGGEFVQTLKKALQNSGAIDTRSIEYDRTKFLKAHQAKSYSDFYSHSCALSVSCDAKNNTISVLFWKPAQDRGLVPVESSKQIFDANKDTSWLQIKGILDEGSETL